MNNEALVLQGLRQKGLSAPAIYGIMANLQHESNFNPRIIQGGGESDEITVDGQTGYGLAQWTSPDRQAGLRDFAASLGTKTSDLGTQIQYMIKEMGPELINQLNSSQSAGQAARLFHDKFERSADTEEMLQGRSNTAETLAQKWNGISVPYQLYNNQGGVAGDINAQLRMDNPNEQLDIEGMMSALRTPMVNGSQRAEQALQREMGYQADLIGLGNGMFQKYQSQADQLAKAAMATATEGAELENRQNKLTGAGKLAQMIANSQNSSNSKMYAALGQTLGVNLSAMDDRYVNSQKMAYEQLTRNQQLQDEQRKIQQQKELADYQAEKSLARQKELAIFNSDLAVEKAKKFAELGLTPSGKSGGSGGLTQKQVIDYTRAINKLGTDYRAEYKEVADRVNAGYATEADLQAVTDKWAGELAAYEGTGLPEYKTVEGMILGDQAYMNKHMTETYGYMNENGVRPGAYVAPKG